MQANGMQLQTGRTSPRLICSLEEPPSLPKTNIGIAIININKNKL